MSRKVEIEFPVDFTTDKTGVHPLGRIALGPLGNNHVGRLVLCSDGNVRLAVCRSVLEKGYIVVYDDYDENFLLGFPTTEKAR